MIVCDKRELRRFRHRAARHFPNEYLELLFGESAHGNVTIQRFVFVPQQATKDWVMPRNQDEYEDIVATTEARTGHDFVGSIHTHTCKHRMWMRPSHCDNNSAHEDEEKVFAIDMIGKNERGRYSHKTLFFQPQQPIEDVAFV